MAQRRILVWGVLAVAVMLASGCWNDLGALPDHPSSDGRAINESGVVAGNAWRESYEVLAFRARPGQPLQALAPRAGGATSKAVGITDDDAVIGISCVQPDVDCSAVSWDAAGTPTVLPGMPPPDAVNGLGDAVGQTQTTTGLFTSQAWIWRHDTKQAINLPSPPGMTLTWATGISDDGFVSGYASAGGPGNYHAVRWNTTAGSVEDLGTGNAYGINDQGVAVGSIENQAARWVPGQPGELIDVGPGVTAGANAINDDGFIVGFSEDGTWGHAWIWSPTTRAASALGGPDEGSSNAAAINDHDEVAGFAVVPFGPIHAARYQGPPR